MNEERRTRITAAFMALSVEMDDLGIRFATLVIDPESQGEGGMVTYAGNLSLTTADTLFAMYVKGRAESEVRNTMRVTSQNDLMQ